MKWLKQQKLLKKNILVLNFQSDALYWILMLIWKLLLLYLMLNLLLNYQKVRYYLWDIGTPHASDGQYVKFEAKLKALNPNFYVGTVEGTAFEAGESSIGGIITKLNALSVKPTTVTISPLMSIAGDHANNDMNGNTGETDPAEQSWRERLDAEGYTVNCVMKGLGDYPEIDAIWMSHLETAMGN